MHTPFTLIRLGVGILPITLRHAACDAGTSTCTESRVIYNKSEIALATRVQAAIPKLAYRPNTLDTSERTGYLQDLHNWHFDFLDFGAILPGVYAELGAGSRVTAFFVQHWRSADTEMQSIEMLALHQVNAVVLRGSCPNANQLQEVSARYNVASITSYTPEPEAVVAILGKTESAIKERYDGYRTTMVYTLKTTRRFSSPA